MKNNSTYWCLVRGKVIIPVMSFGIYSASITGYIKIFRAPTEHVVKKSNVFWVGFMKIVTNLFFVRVNIWCI